MKPDITAPGVEIVAARAAGTSLGEPVDQWYTAVRYLDGRPARGRGGRGHGPALARLDPGPSKAVLMGTAEPHPDLGVYEQGAGRLDVAHAIAQRVIARRANVDFGFFRYPQTGAQPVTKSRCPCSTWAAETAVELRLELEDEDGNPAPAAMASLAPSRRPCPPAARPAPSSPSTCGRAGRYSGAVVATPASGPPCASRSASTSRSATTSPSRPSTAPASRPPSPTPA